MAVTEHKHGDEVSGKRLWVQQDGTNNWLPSDFFETLVHTEKLNTDYDEWREKRLRDDYQGVLTEIEDFQQPIRDAAANLSMEKIRVVLKEGSRLRKC